MKLNKYARLATGIDKTFSDIGDVLVFPNPTNEILNISSTELITNVKIINAKGVLIRNFKNNFQNINIDNFSSGLYFVNITMKAGKINTYKIIKK